MNEKKVKYYLLKENPQQNGAVVRVSGKNIETFFSSNPHKNKCSLDENGNLIVEEPISVTPISEQRAEELKKDYSSFSDNYGMGHCSIFEL